MAEVISFQFANAYAAIQRKKNTFTDAENDAYHEDFKEWYVDANIVSSKLESYFSGTDISERWHDYRDTLFSYGRASRQYFYKAPSEEKKDQQYHLDRIRAYLDKRYLNMERLTMTYDEKLWDNVADNLYSIGQKMIKIF